MAVCGTRAFAGKGAVLIDVDLTDPSAPEEVAELTLDRTVVAVHFSGQFVFVAFGDRGLAIIDASTPGTLVQVGILDSPGSTQDVTVSGAFAYVADYSEGLRVIDVSTPAAPVEVGFLDTPGDAEAVTIAGNTGFLAESDVGLRLIDVTDPTFHTQLGFYEVGGYGDGAWASAISGDHAYVACSNGLHVIGRQRPDRAVAGGISWTSNHGIPLAMGRGVEREFRLYR